MLRHDQTSYSLSQLKQMSYRRELSLITDEFPVCAIADEDTSRSEQSFCSLHEFCTLGEALERAREDLVDVFRIAGYHLYNTGSRSAPKRHQEHVLLPCTHTIFTQDLGVDGSSSSFESRPYHPFSEITFLALPVPR